MISTTTEALLAAIPKRAHDTELHWRQDGARKTAILKDQTNRRYHRLSAMSAWIWSLSDGLLSVSEIAQYISAHGGTSDTRKILASVRTLSTSGLVDGVAISPVVASKTSPAPEAAAKLRTILTWRVNITDVDPTIATLYRRIGRFFFAPPLRALLLGLIGTGFAGFVAACLSHSRPYAELPEGTIWLLLPLILGCVLLHEMAHAMATKHFRREVIGAGFGWFWIGPVFYVDTSDMWLGSRRERILVSLAGPASDLVIAGVCMLVAFTATDSVSSVAFSLATTLYFLVLCNLSPLLEYDGYYALTDFLDRPNLRKKSLAFLMTTSRNRATMWSELSRDKIASAYGFGSLLYLILLIVVSTKFNHDFFKKFFNGMDPLWASPLNWTATIGLLLFLLSGLIADILFLTRSLPQSPIDARS